MTGATKDPYGRSEQANRRAGRDREVLADPDIRGSRSGRRGQYDDARSSTHNSPERVEREWSRGGRG